MRLLTLFIFLFLSSDLLANSFACGEPETRRFDYPRDLAEWNTEEAEDGIYGVTLTILVQMDDLPISSAIAAIPGETDADYLFPLRIEKSTDSATVSYYAPRDKLASINLVLKYHSEADSCIELIHLYSIQYKDGTDE